MNFNNFKYVFLVFGCIYLLDGFFTLFTHNHEPYDFFGYPINKTQELFRQFTTATILFFAYWTQRHK